MPTDESKSYQYSSMPQPAPMKGARTKYREHGKDDSNIPLTLMSDPRVVRGNTHTLAKKLALAGSVDKTNSSLNNSNSNNQLNENNRPKSPSRPTYSFEVKSYAGSAIDLTPFLTQQNDLPPKTNTVLSQTDEFKVRPQTPDYVPRKTGVDISTQVDDVRELFSFDLEVIPIIDVIVQKTLEQALFELRSEEELISLHKEARKHYAENEAEALWKIQKEKETVVAANLHKQMKIDMELLRNERIKVKLMVAGVQLMKRLTPVIFDEIVEGFFSDGTWLRPERVSAEVFGLKPSLEEAALRLKAYMAAKQMTDELISEANKLYEKAPLFTEVPMHSQILLKLIIQSLSSTSEEGVTTIPEVGPIRISHTDTIITLDRAIRQELKANGIQFDFKVKDFIIAAAGRDVALDAPILNFKLPDNLDIVC